MMNLKSLLTLLVIVAAVQARPQNQGTDFGITEGLGQATGIGTTLFSSALTTTRAIGEQIQRMASSAWTAASQAALGMNNAVRESTVGALEGVRSGVGDAGEFVGDSVRTGSRFAASALNTGFDAASDVAKQTGTFVAGVSRSALQSGISTAESAGNLAQGAVQSVGGLARSTNEAVRRTVVGGLENFSNPGRF